MFFLTNGLSYHGKQTIEEKENGKVRRYKKMWQLQPGREFMQNTTNCCFIQQTSDKHQNHLFIKKIKTFPTNKPKAFIKCNKHLD